MDHLGRDEARAILASTKIIGATRNTAASKHHSRAVVYVYGVAGVEIAPHLGDSCGKKASALRDQRGARTIIHVNVAQHLSGESNP